MFRKYGCFILALIALTLCMALTASAEELGSIPAFAREGMTGIYVTGVPEGKLGSVQVDGRAIGSGDVVTAEQLARLQFLPEREEEDFDAMMTFLPVFADRVEPETGVNIAIRSRENKAPVAEDSAAETYKNLPITGKLKVSDPEEQEMTFAVVRQCRRGTVELSPDGSFTYTPKKNKVGIDSFTFTATDAGGKVSREATVTLTILKPTEAAQYTDTLGRECCFAAEWMKNTGIFVGETVGGNPCFSPEKEVTRGEFITMLVKTLDIPVDEKITYTPYGDQVPGWLKPYLAAALRSGLISQLPEQEKFDAGETMTGAEAAVLLCSALDYDLAGEQTAWAERAVLAAREHGFQLEAEDCLTRGETAMLLYQARCQQA